MLKRFLTQYRWPVILLCLWMTTLTGIHRIPLEDHEVFVLQTTREMAAKGEWVLPSFNYEPRLQKPPFNYWATAALSHLDVSSDDIDVWHGRLVSLLAGLVLVLATYHLGTRLFDPVTGRLGALILISAQGYANLTHSARPDFLYSTFSALGLFAWIHAWKAEDGSRRQAAYAWLGWALAGVATLTKGPQVPVLFLAGLTIFLVSGPDRRRTLRILRPFTGVVLFCALVLPWWLLLQQKLKLLNVDIHQTQLSGSLLRNLASLKELASAYYLRTLFGLMLPVSLVAPFLAPRLWKRWKPADEPTRLLIYVSLLLLVVFTLGGHYRKHYMLPLLPVGALFLAQAIGCGADQGLGRIGRRVLYGAILVLGVVFLGLILQQQAYLSLVWLLLSALPLVVLVAGRQEAADMKPYAVQLAPVLVAITILTTGYTAFFPSSMDRWRSAEQAFAQQVGRTLQPGDVIVQWKSDSPILPYFAKRPVVRFDDWKPLVAYYSEHAPAQGVFAVIPKRILPEFLATFDGQTLQSVENRRHPEKDLVFVRLTGLKVVIPQG